ncbi:flippase-like domain-containing protein [Actinomyces sp. B33]|uniref:lysylphosphatidylglycerol synthase transmembrane domain-containing protein n=1 Tax=Actinomyces sp. B33 TaxID=2942131 RepID=UPI002340FC43|nr:lysylphosphatidylglycerol synthase transmembrane domain-containing protein [Actinomyces sp. B33]MDC4233399.1 flippase-like domain-containing protein [Actinomyces sp. B33]
MEIRGTLDEAGGRGPDASPDAPPPSDPVGDGPDGPPLAPARTSSPRPRAPRLPSPVHFADRISPRTRRRADLVDIALALLGIAAVWAVGVFANATTQGITEDVLRFQVIREVLLLPVTVIEGVVVLVAPIGIVTALALRRRLTTIIHAVCAALAAALAGWGITWAVSLLPEPMTAPLRVATAVVGQSSTTDTAIGINLVVVTLCALFTVAGEAHSMRTVRWSWTGLWVILFLGVLRSSMTLPGAVISVLIGRFFGSAARWAFGFEDRRATGADIVEALVAIGIVPSRIVRADLDTDEEPLTTWVVDEDEDGRVRQRIGDVAPADYTVTRRNTADSARHYQAWDESGLVMEVVVDDPGLELAGTLVEVWDNIRLRGISRWVSPSLKASAERSTLTAMTALAGGVRTPEPLGVAEAGGSILTVRRALPPTTPLHGLDPDLVTEGMLDEAWSQLVAAHARGIAHRALSVESVVVDEDGRVWIVDWERGEVATTDLNRRIDIAQMLTLTASAVGAPRALEAARRAVPAERLEACAPVLQGPVLPGSVKQAIRRTDLLTELRSALVSDPAAESEQVVDLRRFQPRTVVMVGVLAFALVVVLGSLNFEDIISAVTRADPVWMGAAAALACLTWVGGAIPLMALSPERLRFWDSVVAQVAASIITIVAPAGVGPAALNLRYLRKKRVPTAVAVTTVTLQQIAQGTMTILMFFLVLLVTGGSISVALPYGTILLVVIGIAVVVGVVLSVPGLRRRVWAKAAPTWQQVYPRLLWVAGQPRRLGMVVAGNLVMTVGFVGAFWASLVAMGGSLGWSQVALTYLASNSLGSLLPSPGGIGPVEAALTGGLQVAGVGLSVGLPTAVLYRLVTFYGRIPVGWLAMKYMERRGLI